ncbi:DUF262 domain-containing protein [Cyanobacterium aponinum UTEX 3221]|uniref:DUF262 domain-containing protein n=1 Tax=Cyanobacterium aponinum (strain PCC 10605) TaxID=755178 RepID=K9Z520_CYAAP|nr:DUF262 domain-containing protein [Cyanobacterium aponinum]AFZ54224.1 protein of unknown function DUF262 [Cyanobacterium aponinum PCC 10605]PHV64254.1 DUF262 domain-containing protein [Cyanobacterium aponinum IPPAS B-1201]WRL37457.1 DUF262 domain-containing protein [Cyanobacterium aponinum UTEX 3221]
MQAGETTLKEIIQGEKQYIVPLFQRSYSWGKPQWEQLWSDIVELLENESNSPHFFGSIVTMQMEFLPEEVSKFLLIDGQQRLTTILILLATIRDQAKIIHNLKLFKEINDKYLINAYDEGENFYKLLPTQIDRQSFYQIINEEYNHIKQQKNLIAECYQFFTRKIKRFPETEYKKLINIIGGYLIVISIVLSKDDNPYLVFESLNAKGQPLTQADLIRNYLFMGIQGEKQDKMYQQYWLPMENLLQDNLTDFLRYYLTKKGKDVKKNQVYFELKEQTIKNNVSDYLKDIYKFANYYSRFLDPNQENNIKVRKYLIRIKSLDIKTVYPFLLNCYDDWQTNKLSETEFIDVCKIIENFIIRRFVCNVQTRGLNRIFALLYTQVSKNIDLENINFLDELKRHLQTQDYPQDEEFREKIKQVKLYGSNRTEKARLILESMEESFGHKEKVSFENLTIEHIMPQRLNEWWKNHLGEDYEITHELLLHSLGNLTLTAYNSELSNDSFINKQKELKNSHLEINKYFQNISQWRREEIDNRAEKLADMALTIWSYFGDKNYKSQKRRKGVTGTTPRNLKIFDEEYSVKTWRDVLETTLNIISEVEADKFEELILTFPRFLSKNRGDLRVTRQLKNGIFIEVQLSAQDIYSFCQKILETCDLSNEDWQVIIEE